jgi:Ca-activated chloride channel family protein
MRRGWRLRIAAWALVACATPTVAVVLLGAQSQVFRGGVETVEVTVTVTDADGRLVTGLSKDDVLVFEDGRSQVVTHFTDARVPVSLGILLDISDSMVGQPIADAQRAVDPFMGDLLGPENEVFVATFNHVPRLVETWTRQPALLRERLAYFRPTGSTALYDALAAAAPLFEQRAHGRAALLVISDGADTASDLSLVRLRSVLQRGDPFVYAVALDSSNHPRESSRVNPDVLRQPTGPSGGYTEVVHDSAELGPATERIANELNHQYTIAYSPTRPPDGRWRSIRVRLRDEGHVARARRGYFAVPLSAPAG